MLVLYNLYGAQYSCGSENEITLLHFPKEQQTLKWMLTFMEWGCATTLTFKSLHTFKSSSFSIKGV